MTQDPLFKIKNLRMHFPVESGSLQRLFSSNKEFVHAVDNISLTINQNEIFCLVGESGCGKSTTANILVGLDKPTTGDFFWNGKKISFKQLIPKKKDIKSQIIFQNPFSALNPRMTLGDIVLHPLIIHNRLENTETKRVIQNAKYAEVFLFLCSLLSLPLFIFSSLLNEPFSIFIILADLFLVIIAIVTYFYFSVLKRNRLTDKTVLKIFNEIGLSPPEHFYFKYPHEISGGERQRVSIARAIILNPKLLIADEPTSMLDVSCRAGILDLLKSLQKSHGLSILFITHDLATARHFGDYIGVMYVGKIVEKGTVEDLFQNPLHPYTRALIDAIPSIAILESELKLPKGEVADAITPPEGCRFHPRCPIADLTVCGIKEPQLVELTPNHWVACHSTLS